MQRIISKKDYMAREIARGETFYKIPAPPADIARELADKYHADLIHWCDFGDEPQPLPRLGACKICGCDAAVPEIVKAEPACDPNDRLTLLTY